jgi:hypothetical protein
MEARKALCLVALVALAGAHAVSEDGPLHLDEGVHPLDDGSIGEEGGKAVKTVTVNVKGPKARAPEPTVKTLTPKHKALQKKAGKKKNKGKIMSKGEKKEVARLAKVEAAKEINKSRKTKSALKKSRRKEAELRKNIKKMKATVRKVKNNNAYATNQKDRKEARKVKAANKKLARNNKATEKAEKATAKEKYELKNADVLLKKAKATVRAANLKLVKEQREDEDNEDSITKSGEIVAKDKGELENQGEVVFRSEHFLEHVEDHEEAARVEEKEARIKVDFETEDAKKVKMLLAKLEAKKAAVDKFTKNLDKKAKRDFKAAKVGIAKAKGDYAKAKGKYDKFTKKAAKWQAKKDKTIKLKKAANQGVVLGLSMGKDDKAISSAENHTYLRKVEGKDTKKVDANDIKAKGQNKMMGASMKELEKAEALDTVSRKEGVRVKLNRQTMSAQVKKIAFYKKEVAEHEKTAADAKKRADKALHRAKTIRETTETKLQKAKARQRWLKNVDIPLAIKAGKKAKALRINSKQEVKEAKDAKIDAIKKEKYYDKLVQKASNKKVLLKTKLKAKKKKAKVAKKAELKAKDKQADTKFKQKQKRNDKKAKIKAGLKKKAGKKKAKGKKKKGKREDLAEVNELREAAKDAFIKKYGFAP